MAAMLDRFPIQEFRIYPAQASLYVVVKIFKSKKQMYTYFKHAERGRKRVGLGFEAIVCNRHTVSYRNGKCGKSSQKVAEMLFNHRRMTMEIITHESGHAALAWFRRRYPKVDLNASMYFEEKFCYPLGFIAKEIVCRTRKIKTA